MRIKKEDVEKHFETITTKVKRSTHPNEWKYPGRSGNEQNMALLNFLKPLTKEQMDLFSKGKYISNAENTSKFLDDLKPEDLIGIKDTKYRVVSKDKNGCTCEIRNTNKTVEISLAAIDYALAIGFAEILFRNGEFFGIDQEEEIKILVPKAVLKEEEEKKIEKEE